MSQAADHHDDAISFDDVRSAFRSAAVSGEAATVAAMVEKLRVGPSPPWSICELAELGNAMMQLRLFDAAGWAYETIRGCWPQDAVGWRGSALVAAHLEDWPACARLWQESLARCPTDLHQSWWLASHADALLRVGQLERAAEINAALRARWPEDPAGWRGGALLALRNEDWAGAARFWRACLARTTEENQPLWYWASLADALMKQRDHDAAAAVYQSIRERWPGDPLGWQGSAVVAAQLERWEEAAEFWKRCLGPRPTDRQPSWWWASYADTLLRLERRELAASVLASLRAQWPHDPAGWRGGARLIAEASGWRRAIRQMTGWREAALRSQAPGVHAEYILALLRAGAAAEAWQETEAYCSLHGRDRSAAGLLMEVARLGGDPRGVLALLLQLGSSVPFEACPPKHLAALLFNAGLTRREADSTLTSWLGPEDNAEHLDPLYALPLTDNTKLADLADAHLSRKRTVFTRVQLRQLLVQFLKDRSYACFEALVATAIATAGPRELGKLSRLADKRFPRSRLALQLRGLVTAGSSPLSADDNAFAYRWRNVLPEEDLSIAAQLAGRPWRRLACVLVIRDEDELLPLVLAHYVRLGVTSFIVVDNGSANDPAAVLRSFAEAEFTLVRAPGDFAASRHGMVWINEILESGCCDWLLFVDCDEFLTFPGDADMRLPQLLDHFDARGETAMFAPMVDAFDAAFARGEAPSGRLEDHRFIAADIRFEPTLLPPWVWASGGARRIINYLGKVPLAKAAAGVRYITNHFVTDCRPAGTTGALVHHKIYRDRDFFVSELEDVAAHSRVRDRGMNCMSRHLAMARLRITQGPEQAFHVELTPDRLLALGYMAADREWRAKLPCRLVPDRLTAGKPLQRQLVAATNGRESTALADMPLEAVLKQLAQAADTVSRGDLRILLNAHLARVGPGEVRCAMLLHVAQLLGKKAAAERLLRRLLGLLDRGSTIHCAHALAATAAAMGPSSDAADAILTTLAASDSPPRMVVNLLAESHLRQGRLRGARDLCEQNDPMADDQSVVLYLRSLEGLRDWDRYLATMFDMLEQDRISLLRKALERINVFPDATGRREMLARQYATMRLRIEELDGEGLSKFLAICHLLGHADEFASVFAAREAQLPRLCRTYFNRLSNAAVAGAPPNQAWCVGLSKTGTTSFHVFCGAMGLASAHWVNPVLGTLLSLEDGDLFDVVSDSTITYLARLHGVPSGRKVIATTRAFEPWSRSFMRHFQLDLAAPGASFDEMKDIVSRGERMHWGGAWQDIHHELHFRFRDLAESYDYHHEWLRGLRRDRGEFFLEVPLEDSDEAKAQAIRRFLGEGTKAVTYPHSNRAVSRRF